MAASPAVAARLHSLRPTAVNSVLTEIRALQGQGRQIISLMRGEPDLPTPSHIVEACTRALRDGRTSYPDNRGEPSLRDAAAAKLQRENGVAYDPAVEILVTSGATFGIYAALAALVNPGDQVMMPDPVYDAYYSPVMMAGGIPIPVRARIANGRFVMTPDDLQAAWSPQVKVLLLNTPWNPTGTVFDRAELGSIAEWVLQRGVWLVSDEIYEAITYDGVCHICPAALSADLKKRCIVVNSLSKTYSMTGWRVGYSAAPQEITSAMFMVLQQSSRGPATFVQDAAAVALTGDQTCIEAMRAEYAARRSMVIERLAGVPKVHLLAPQGGFFAMADVREKSLPSNDIRWRLLQDQGVAVMHGSAYGAGGEGTLRISFASGGERLVRGLDLLCRGLNQL